MPPIVISPVPVGVYSLPPAPTASDGASVFASKAGNFFEALAVMVMQVNGIGSGYGALSLLPNRPTERSAAFAAEADTFFAALPDLVSDVNDMIAELSLPVAAISALPPVPSRTADPANFPTKAAVFLAAMPGLGSQLNSFIFAFNLFAPAVSYFSIVGPGAFSEGGGDLTFTVYRSGAIGEAASIDWAVQAISSGLTASDFGSGSLPAGTLFFVPGQRSASITLPVSDDANVEGDETFRVVLTNAFMGDSDAAIIAHSTATATITDNDTGSGTPAGASTFSITPPSPANLNEGPKSASTIYVFTVSRTGGLSKVAYVDWAVTGSGLDPATPIDFGLSAFPSGTLAFAASESSKSLLISVKGDTLVEPDEGFTVTLSNPRMADATAGGLGTGSASATIVNDDSVDGGSGPAFAIGATDGSAIMLADGTTPLSLAV